MPGFAVDVRRQAALDDLSGIHDVHAVRVAGHDAQVVRDDDEGDAHAFGEVFHQLENLGLDGDVQSCRRFIGNDELGLAAKRHRDHHPLAHPAAQVVGVLPDAALRLGDTHQAQIFDRLFLRVGPVHAEVMLHRLGELQPDGQDGVQGSHGFLEDHADLAAPDISDLEVIEPYQILTLKAYRSPDDAAGRIRYEAENRERADGLPAARLADYRHRLAFLHVVGDAVDRLDDTGGGEKMRSQVFDFKKRAQRPLSLQNHLENAEKCLLIPCGSKVGEH